MKCYWTICPGSTSSHTPPSSISLVASENGRSPRNELLDMCDNLSEMLGLGPMRINPQQELNLRQTSDNVTAVGATEDMPFTANNASVQVYQTWLCPNTSTSPASVHSLNPWLQKLVPASNAEVFDGDTNSWPRFIAGFKSMIHDSLSSEVDHLGLLARLLSFAVRGSCPL
ncbi:hypothetical protein M514_11238 [Trichuris suis]|uniref:Uncharacterized protein n=1 Tax=Trichuris suis TaxID=68888 RepID=A0A085N583_9BILA|nr:hypothetical protein M513_11238 [Trichuris suis]KFD64629.1 hypothetical protein M514_11238 [Trichuris suis]